MSAPARLIERSVSRMASLVKFPLSIAARNTPQHLKRRAVEDRTIFVDDAAVSVARIFTQTHVGNDRGCWDLRFYRPDSILHDAANRSAPRLVFCAWHPEYDDRWNTEFRDRLGLRYCRFDGVTIKSRQGGDSYKSLCVLIDK